MSEETERTKGAEELAGKIFTAKLRGLHFDGPDLLLRERTLLAVRRTLRGESETPAAGLLFPWWQEALLTAAILACLAVLPLLSGSPSVGDKATAVERARGESILSVLDLDEDFADHVNARLGLDGRTFPQSNTLINNTLINNTLINNLKNEV